MQRELTTEDELYRIGIVFLVGGAAGIYVALRWILPAFPELECVFVKNFGLYCPGCGGTRAVIELLRGHFLRSLWYHPIVLYTVALFGWFMLSQPLERLHITEKLHLTVRGMKFHEWHLYGALAIIVANCIIKNVLKLYFHVLL